MKSNAEILKEILAIAKTDLMSNGEMGYTMPDGKHHIYIYADQEDRWDGRPGETFYVVEPNRVVDGAHDPMGDTYLTGNRDLSEVLVGCQWCMDTFEADLSREAALPDELIVRLAHEAGWMEAEGKIEVHSWEDVQTAIRDAITEYYETPSEHNPFSIEETIEKILLERFPSEPEPVQSMNKEILILTCTLESEYGINTYVSLHPDHASAVKHAAALEEEEKDDNEEWNFSVSSEVIDVSAFPDAPVLDNRTLRNENLPTLSDPQPSEQLPEKKSLNDRIHSAQDKQLSQISPFTPPGKDISR